MPSFGSQEEVETGITLVRQYRVDLRGVNNRISESQHRKSRDFLLPLYMRCKVLGPTLHFSALTSTSNNKAVTMTSRFFSIMRERQNKTYSCVFYLLYCVFYKLKSHGNPALNKSIGAMFFQQPLFTSCLCIAIR